MANNTLLKKWKTLNSEIAFDNKWFRLQKDTVQLPNGKVFDDFYLWKSNGVVLILPQLKNGNLVITQQYKHGLGDISYEFPGGYIDDGETDTDAAARELREESGLTSSEIVPLGIFHNHPSKETGAIHAFLAKNCEFTSKQDLDETEEINLVEKTLEETRQLILDGELTNAGSICAFYLFLNN